MSALPTPLGSNRLLIRKFQPSDCEPFTQFLINPEVTRYLPFPETIKIVEEKATHSFVGWCGMNSLNEQAVEISYTIMPEYWSRSITTEIAQTLSSYSFEQMDIKTVKVFIMPGHEVSKRVAVKVSFQDMGLLENPNFAQRVHQYALISTPRSSRATR